MEPGRQPGPYIVEGLLGAGGVGKLNRARRTSDGQLLRALYDLKIWVQTEALLESPNAPPSSSIIMGW